MRENLMKIKGWSALLLLCSLVFGGFCACAPAADAPAGTEEIPAATDAVTDEETEAAHAEVIAALREKLGAIIRDN